MNQTDKPTGVPEDEFEMPKEVWDRFVKKYPSFDYDDDAPEPHQDYCAKLGYKFALPELTAKEEEIAKLKEEVERGVIGIPTAIKVLTEALSEDKSEGSYYYSWQANIAMSFIDEYQRLNPHMRDGNKEILHKIANRAAKNFLDLLCLISHSPTTKK